MTEKIELLMRRGKKLGSFNNAGKVRNSLIDDFFVILQAHYTGTATELQKRTRIYAALEELAATKPVDYIRVFTGLIKQDSLVKIQDKEELNKEVVRTVKYVG